MTILIVSPNKDVHAPILEYLESKKLKGILAQNNTEAKLKITGEDYSCIVVDMDFNGFNALNFVESIRRKEELKSVKALKPIIVIGSDPKSFEDIFGARDQLTFLQTPFKAFDFKKKMLSFSGKSDVLDSNTITVKKDDYLINEGTSGHDMYWVIDGKFVITKLNKEGKKIIIGEVAPGELVGEMSFLDDLPRSASVKALEDSEVLKIPHRKFMDVLDSQPRWFRSLMRTLSQRMRASNNIIARKQASLDDDFD